MLLSLALQAASATAVASPLSAQVSSFTCQAPYVFQGLGPGDHLGADCSPPGDWNGDGRPDVLLGGLQRWNEQPEHRGVVQLYAGEFQGSEGRERLESPSIVFRGSRGGERFGYSARFVGDLDGDGRDDIAIGAPRARRFERDGTVTFGERGALHLFLSSEFSEAKPGTQLTAEEASLTIVGQRPGARFGWTSCGLGDRNGDGLGELAVSAISSERGRGGGRVWILDGAKLHGRGSEAAEDGREPRILLAPTLAANVFEGEAGDRFGFALHHCKTRGLAIGAPQLAAAELRDPDSDPLGLKATGDGYVALIANDQLLPEPGPTPSMRVLSNPDPGSRSHFGRAVHLSQSGLLVGAPAFDRDGPASDQRHHGRVQRFEPETLELEFTLTGETAGDFLGWSTFALPDLDGDEVAELAVGVLLHDEPEREESPCPADPRAGSPGAGAVLVVSGASPSDEPQVLQAVYGQDGRDRMSWSMKDFGEWQGEHWMLLGALAWPDDRRGDDNNEEAGRAYLVPLVPPDPR